MQSNAKQGSENHPSNWTWIESTIWTERMLAALGNGVKGDKWFSLWDKVYRPQTLRLAWLQVKSKKGSAGIDKVSIARFERKADSYLEELAQALETGTYQPEAVKRVYIPKGNGQTRPLGIPAVKDRVVQTALQKVIEPIFEKEFLDVSYGFRPQRGCKDALREVDRLLKEGYTWVVDADVKGYFDNIPHQPLLERVAERISDGRVLGLVGQFLKQPIMEELNSHVPTTGTPQGAVVSPLLANIYLHPLDKLIAGAGHKMVRYADDFVILCKTREEAEQALEKVKTWTTANELTLHPDKTHLGNCMEAGQGFEFLGYRFESGNRFVRKKSIMKLRDAIREKTKRCRNGSIELIIADLNRTLKGWFVYFKHAHRATFRAVDGFVRRRLRSILRRWRKKQGGTGRCLTDHKRWPNKFFADLGLFTLETAHGLARRSRCGN